MRYLAYRFLNTRIGRRLRYHIDAGMRAHPYWRTIKGIKVKYACATDIDVNKRAIRNGLGYDNEWILSKKVNTLIDLGCNTGLFTLWLAAAQNWKPKGLAIDANPEMCARAKEHFKANQIEMNVHNGLVGEPGENGVLHTHSITVSSSTVGDVRPWGAQGGDVEVPCMDIGKMWGPNPVDLMKLDIEGSELGFFEDERAMCNHARRIVVEWHEPQCSLSFIREKLFYSHRLVKFHTHKWIGCAYFEHL